MQTYHTINSYKVFRAFCPRWQHDITEWLSVIVSAEVVAVAIREHVRQVEELGNQLLQT